MSNQHSKCGDCYKTHLPEVHDMTILPSDAFSKGYVPEFNQASEDERPRAVQNGMSQEEYGTWMFLADKAALDEPYTYMIKQSDLTKWVRSLIRTGKLKLLAEVRERVVGEDEDRNHRYNENWKVEVDAQNYLRKEQRTALTKLEAEL